MNTEDKTNRAYRDADRQIDFCISLMESLKRSWNMNTGKPKWYSHQPIANSTQIQADARRLRRELMLLIKILDERG
jgi:hypothetical protein